MSHIYYLYTNVLLLSAMDLKDKSLNTLLKHLELLLNNDVENK